MSFPSQSGSILQKYSGGSVAFCRILLHKGQFWTDCIPISKGICRIHSVNFCQTPCFEGFNLHFATGSISESWFKRLSGSPSWIPSWIPLARPSKNGEPMVQWDQAREPGLIPCHKKSQSLRSTQLMSSGTLLSNILYWGNLTIHER